MKTLAEVVRGIAKENDQINRITDDIARIAGQTNMLADGDRLRIWRSRRGDDHRRLYLFNLAGCVVYLLLQIAHLARKRIESLLLVGTSSSGGCGRSDHVMMAMSSSRRCRCGWICRICRPHLHVA